MLVLSPIIFMKIKSVLFDKLPLGSHKLFVVSQGLEFYPVPHFWLSMK
ncbi:hypothetical protein N748_01410 [Legionella pneumophila str. 121004]|nr:hypothetical protein N748_01410 [Legionella pneumophila str. 121004]ERH42596.1 hypothetical protein N751_03550 [Legionella pneumophila str. Leg01/11]ERH44329.1 hypothetical protein N750_01620 [Legionella pneumophila str. Leg01/53]ERI47793.1 hypothetical protein N749_01865 [Legionella pneumophila str. Leg01/20]